MFHADNEFALRHERAAMAIEAAYARAHAAAYPESGVATFAVADGSAVFAGIGSPMTQTTGLGMEGPIADSDLEELEAFFAERSCPTRIVVCPHADDSLFAGLNRRGYRLVEFESVMVRPLTEEDRNPPKGTIELKLVTRDEADRYADAVGPNFTDDGKLTPEFRAMMMALFDVENTASLLARIDGVDVGGGALLMHQGLALLAGAGTLPPYRNRGVQAAVFTERLRLASQAGCTVAVMGARPGSGSQRNAERKGFRVAYTKAVLEKPCV